MKEDNFQLPSSIKCPFHLPEESLDSSFIHLGLLLSLNPNPNLLYTSINVNRLYFNANPIHSNDVTVLQLAQFILDFVNPVERENSTNPKPIHSLGNGK